MRGLFVPLGNARLVEGGHLIENADRSLEQRQCEHCAGALAQPEVELQQRSQSEAPQDAIM